MPGNSCRLPCNQRAGSLARPSYPPCRSSSTHPRTSSCAAASQSQGKIKPSWSSTGVKLTTDAVDLVTVVESQAGQRAAVETAEMVGAAETAARAAEVSRGGGASIGSSSAATAKPGGRTCWVCKSDQHYVRDCPKQICQRCDGRGHNITKCGQMENAVMAIGVLCRTSTDDESPVCSEADLEAYTTLEVKTGKCFVSIIEEGRMRQIGECLWLLDTGAIGHFTYDLQLLGAYAECSRALRYAGGNTFPIVGTGTLRLSLRSGKRVVCVTLMNVAHVPGLSHHLLSLRRSADAGNKYIGT